MSKSYINLGYGAISDNYKKGRLTASLLVNGKYQSGKSVSLHSVTPEIAYDTVTLWAETQSKELSIEYRPTPLAKLMAKINKTEYVEQVGSESPVVMALNNKLLFKAALKEGYRLFGYARIKDVVDHCMESVKELEVEEQNKNKIKDDAAKTVAATLFEIFKTQGIDMSSTINDERTLAHFKELKAEHEV